MFVANIKELLTFRDFKVYLNSIDSIDYLLERKKITQKQINHLLGIGSQEINYLPLKADSALERVVWELEIANIPDRLKLKQEIIVT